MNENGYYIPPEDEENKTTSSENDSVFAPTPPPQQNFEETPEPSPEFDRKSVITRACSSGLFLAICVLSMIYTIISFVPITYFSVSPGDIMSFSYNMSAGTIINLLVTIGLWMVYGAAQKGELALGGMMMVSGSLKALRIINWILIPFMFLASVGMTVGGILLFANEVFRNEIMNEITEVIPEIEKMLSPYLGGEIIDQLIEYLLTPFVFAALFLLIAFALVIAATVMIFMNIFFYGYLYKFARSLREWVEGNANALRAVRGSANWLIVMAVLSIMGGSMLYAVILICASVFIKRNFSGYAEK